MPTLPALPPTRSSRERYSLVAETDDFFFLQPAVIQRDTHPMARWRWELPRQSAELQWLARSGGTPVAGPKQRHECLAGEGVNPPPEPKVTGSNPVGDISFRGDPR